MTQPIEFISQELIFTFIMIYSQYSALSKWCWGHDWGECCCSAWWTIKDQWHPRPGVSGVAVRIIAVMLSWGFERPRWDLRRRKRSLRHK